MLAEIITIGDELLIGQVIDTNSAFIAKQLNKIGVSVYQITSIQDDKQHILQALADAETRVDIVICTGGLGPTKDDITKKTIAEYFNDTLVKNEAVLKNIESIWKQHVRTQLLQVNKDQALIPSKSKPLMNRLGTAPGMWLEKADKVFISLPGVPYEMKALIDNEVIPKLKEKYNCPFILHKTLIVYGVNEYAGLEDEDGSVEVLIAKKLTALGRTLAIAESCTGGAVAQCFTARSGASAFFKGGVVTYSPKL